GSNISQTRIPDAHFAYEARYNGAKLVGISPDFNSSMPHMDLYLSIQPGTDVALALGAAKHIIDSGLYDEHYVKEQTDLALLVDKRTGRFIRPEGVPDVFLFRDAKTGVRKEAPGSMGSKEKTIALGAADPDLSYEDGDVTPAFNLLRRRIEPYTVD